MKLEVGMYVRNNHFGVGKINKEYFDSNNKHWFNVQFNCYKDEDCHCGICEETTGFKASFNLIDLIEVGDYVNGEKVYLIDWTMVVCLGSGANDFGYKENEIKSILTKELYEANCYKVVE